MHLASDSAVGASPHLLDALLAADHSAVTDEVFVRLMRCFATDPEAVPSFARAARTAVS